MKEIGGYFGIEIKQSFDNIQNNIVLNSASNCLRLTIKRYNIKEIYAPYYTCPVVWQSIKKENCNIKFYHIDEKFMPTMEFPENSYILYTNYFGICARNVKLLVQKYKNLIVDNAQAFYMPKYGIASFNSIRKFFGVPDGAFLYTDKDFVFEFKQDTSYQRCSHLFKRIDVDAQFGYQDFCENDRKLVNDEIKLVSNLTKYIFNSIDIQEVRKKRLENFNFLHKNLSSTNELNISLDNADVPMIYPYLIKDNTLRKKLIENKIYVATYWDIQEEGSQEDIFQKYLLPLPIDQRYGINDMSRIVKILK